MRDRLADLVARAILATRVMDRAYGLLEALRAEFVLALATDRLLSRINDRRYEAIPSYRPSANNFERDLFAWEKLAVEHFFPPAPARVLVGGAGGGREALELAERGYSVVAFEPSAELAAELAERGRPAGVGAFRARYEDMPRLRPARPGDPDLDLDAAQPFDAAIIGWGSLSHLRTRAERVRALAAFGRATTGPIMASFEAPHRDGPRRPGRLRRFFLRLPGRFNREVGDRFSMTIGFFHQFDEPELTELAEEAGLRLLHFEGADRDVWYSHAVLARR